MAAYRTDNLTPLRRTVYVGTFIHCSSLTEIDVIESAAVGVDENGVIAFIEKGVEAELAADLNGHGWTDYELVRSRAGQNTFWFPGFIDTHIHASQFPNAGIFGKTTLISWLNKYTFPLESSLASIQKARSVYSRCITNTLAHGTTTASYYATIHTESTNILSDLCYRIGQRAFIGRCGMDSDFHPDYYRDASAATALEATQATIDHIDAIDPAHKLITPILTPRFAPSCTLEFMSHLGDLQKATGLPIQTHISENDTEIQLVKELFPAHENYADVYDACGLLNQKTVLAHCIHLSPSEMSLIQKRGCSVSHCPASNSHLGSGICQVRELLDAGINVGLGTDMSGGYSPSILAAAREAGGVSRLRSAFAATEMQQIEKDRLKLSVEETLYLATRGGAKCLGLEHKIGGFHVGMEWDAQYIDLGPTIRFNDDGTQGGRGNVQIWEGMVWEEMIAKWVLCGDDRNTRAVWVAGRLIFGVV